MKFVQTAIPDVIIVQPRVHYDERGFFMETYQKIKYYDGGINFEFVQSNQSSSTQFTLRGLHYQITHTQGKLVRAVTGEIFDVAVDIRKSSPYFGKWVGAHLSEENKQQLWIPPGFAHGFFTLSNQAYVAYKTTDYYDHSGERSIIWNDPDIGIQWPIPEGATPLVSPKDKAAPQFKNAELFS